MSKTIHIHIHGRTRDADGPAHAPAGSPKGGQFVSSGGGGGGSSGGASHGRPQHTPMKQANRNLEARQLKESRQVVKQSAAGSSMNAGNLKSVRQMQAESDVAEAKKRIDARKSSSQAPSKTTPSSAPAKKTATVASPRSDTPALNVSAAQREKANKAFKKQEASTEAKAHKDLESHSNYHKEDHEYLKGKGYTAGEIKAIWDRDAKAGNGPQTKNKNSKEMQAQFAGTAKAMFGK